MKLSKVLLLFLFFLNNSLQAQIDGDNIFGEDQIINIELTFSQVGFYDSLVANYATTTYMAADLTLTDQSGTYTFEDVAVRFKGNSSYNHPGEKKSFKIDFNKYVGGQNYDGLKKLNFSNGFKDPTFIREKVFYDVCRAADIAAPRSNYANVYFNGTLWGFYTVIEQIDDQFLDWKILDDDGNLFKAGDNFGGGPGGGGDAADLLYYGDEQSAYEAKYELKTNEEENDWTDLIELIDFINNSSDAEFEAELGDHIELQEYLRSAAMDNLFSNLDSYTGSARNYYLYHNLTTNKWEWIKWDGNESFGSYGAGGGPGGGIDLTTLALDYHDTDRPLLEQVFNSPTFYDQYLAEACYLVDNFFNPTYMDNRIDELADLIRSSVYADPNKMYTDANFDANITSNITSGGGPGGGTLYGLKSFVSTKYNFVTGAIDCSQLTDVENIESGSFKIYPNPSYQLTTIEWDIPLSSLTIYNTLGQAVHQETIQDQTQLQLDVSVFQPGMYVLLFKGEQGEFSSRLVVNQY